MPVMKFSQLVGQGFPDREEIHAPSQASIVVAIQLIADEVAARVQVVLADRHRPAVAPLVSC